MSLLKSFKSLHFVEKYVISGSVIGGLAGVGYGFQDSKKQILYQPLGAHVVHRTMSAVGFGLLGLGLAYFLQLLFQLV